LEVDEFQWAVHILCLLPAGINVVVQITKDIKIMRKLSFVSIEYFLKVAETLNFSVAARELYISQPALSKQIRLLEEDLGVRLFTRDTKQVLLTEGGKILYQEWSELLRRSEKAIGAAKNAQEKHAKKIRVGILEFAGMIHKIAPVLEKFTESEGNTEVIYEVHGFSQLRKMLNSGAVDMIFSLNSELPIDKHNIFSQALFEMQLCIVVSPKSPLYDRESISVGDLKNEVIYLFSEEYSESARRSVLTHFAKEGVATQNIKEFPNIRSMEMALAHGGGVTIGYREFFEQQDKFKFFPIQDRIGLHQLVMAWKDEKEKQVHELIKFCTEQDMQADN